MKKLILIAFCAIVSLNVNAQAFEQGSSALSIGHGYSVSKALYKAYESFTGFNQSGIGPVHLKYEYFVSDAISVGLSARLNTNKIAYETTWEDNNQVTQTGELGFKSTSIGALAKVNFYWLRKDKLMMYSGIGAGYNYLDASWFSDDPDFDEALQGSITLPPIGMELTAIGAKFMFAPSIGAYVELGIGPIAQAGLVIGFGGGGGRF
jgi:opacity protein-like surface antigen